MLERKELKLPMMICDRTFQLVHQHLKALDYSGPVSLSWDDTKLLAAWRLRWDAEQQSVCLVGCVEGPLRVADPDELQAIMADPERGLGQKVGAGVNLSVRPIDFRPRFGFS